MYGPIDYDPDKLRTIISGSENLLSQTGTESDISTIKSTKGRFTDASLYNTRVLTPWDNMFCQVGRASCCQLAACSPLNS